ncbi:NAD(P)/FAD-dependent oxidoreductase [Pseudoalteromonas lipolytica]|uniref:NAD(P)/FAD-dependent oxidoreductase n=1 Tax=Pseudoalteromonas lipolytica TaxID=570156 RepID=UPI0013C3249E|nr:FAD-dependent oxidoreductase [Pseudoalteromonas donghaensis]
MTNTRTQRVAVIGAGVIGICTALQLQQAGFAVTLYDENGLAQGCSKGNAGHFATEQVFPLAQVALLKKLPAMLFNPLGPLRIDWRYAIKALPWFWQFIKNMPSARFIAHTHALKALNEHAIHAYERLLANYQLGHLLTKQGSLLTFEKTPLVDVQRTLAMYQAQGIKVKLLDTKQVHALEPSLSDKIKHALLFEDVAHSIEPHLFCIQLAQKFSLLKGQFRQQKVVAITPKSEGFMVSDEQDSLNFDKVVIAAGAWSASLIEPLGYTAPLDTERGYHCMVNINHGLTRPVASAERSLIMTPMSQGLRVAGTVEFAGINRKANNKRALALLPHAQALLASQPLSAKTTWMGCRPSLPDSLPIIGQAPNHNNLYFAFGHQHLGLTQGAITSELITDLCLNKAPSINLEPYSINRFMR